MRKAILTIMLVFLTAGIAVANDSGGSVAARGEVSGDGPSSSLELNQWSRFELTDELDLVPSWRVRGEIPDPEVGLFPQVQLDLFQGLLYIGMRLPIWINQDGLDVGQVFWADVGQHKELVGWDLRVSYNHWFTKDWDSWSMRGRFHYDNELSDGLTLRNRPSLQWTVSSMDDLTFRDEIDLGMESILMGDQLQANMGFDISFLQQEDKEIKEWNYEFRSIASARGGIGVDHDNFRVDLYGQVPLFQEELPGWRDKASP